MKKLTAIALFATLLATPMMAASITWDAGDVTAASALVNPANWSNNTAPAGWASGDIGTIHNAAIDNVGSIVNWNPTQSTALYLTGDTSLKGTGDATFAKLVGTTVDIHFQDTASLTFGGDFRVGEGNNTGVFNLYIQDSATINMDAAVGDVWMTQRESHTFQSGGTINVARFIVNHSTATHEFSGGTINMLISDAGVFLPRGNFNFIGTGGTVTQVGDHTAWYESLVSNTNATGTNNNHIQIGGVTTSALDLNKFNISYSAGTGLTTFELVPEPATMSLLALGGVAMLKRRKK